MLGLSKLAKAYGDRTLFEDVSLELNEGARYGLVGANGSGKTTLLRVIAGDEPATEGTVSFPKGARVGVLRQDRFLDDAQPILHVAMAGDGPAWSALSERARIVDHGEGDPTRLADLEDVLASHDGHTLEARATAVLSGLGIPIANHRLPLSTLSGGFKLRVLLAQVLLGGPDAVLLDEPTNHLDILSIRWLETFLASYRGVALVISHDQRFLENTATHILDVDYGTVTLYPGTYSAFVAEKAAVYERKAAEIARTEEIIADKRAFVERFGAKASKAKQAQSRLKQIEKIEVEELRESTRRAPHFRFEAERPSGKDVLIAKSVDKSFGDKSVLRDVTLTVRRGEKVAIIGPNGLGKSTLLKIVTDRLPKDRGDVAWGHEVRVGYFAQDHHELLLNDAMTPLDFVWEAVPREGTSYVRGQLGRMLFTGRDVEKPIGMLSGGEAARLVFARLSVEKPNVLVLDEPTNHLDIESIGALSEGLAAFEGTVLFVSHDRWFVSALATRIVEITESGLRDFPGTYAEYLERRGDDHLDREAVVAKAKAVETKATSPEAQLSWEEQKRRRNRRKALPQLRDEALLAVEAAEAKRAALTAKYEEPGFFERTSREDLARLEAERAASASEIEAAMAAWEELEREIAEGEEA